MKYNNPLEIANITTDVLADYLYKAISELDNSELVKFDNVEYIKDYLDNTIDSVSYTHLTLPTTCTRCRSRWSPYH